jgi:hypothetical protein
MAQCRVAHQPGAALSWCIEEEEGLVGHVGHKGELGRARWQADEERNGEKKENGLGLPEAIGLKLLWAV